MMRVTNGDDEKGKVVINEFCIIIMMTTTMIKATVKS